MAGHHRNKDDSCVVGGRSHGGYFILAPGSPPCVWCPLLCACRHNRSVVLAQHSTVANSSWSFRPNIKACTAVPWFVWRPWRNMAVRFLACLEYLLWEIQLWQIQLRKDPARTCVLWSCGRLRCVLQNRFQTFSDVPLYILHILLWVKLLIISVVRMNKYQPNCLILLFGSFYPLWFKHLYW